MACKCLISMIKSGSTKCFSYRYFFAEIQTQLLLEQITSRDLRSALENLPTRTEDVVKAVLDLVMVQPSHLRTLARTTLIWLADQKRPFKMRGLCEALALRRDEQFENSGSVPWPNADSIPCEDAVIRYCKGLVTMDYGESTAVLAHYYDLAPYLSRYWESSYRTELTNLTLTCLSYILFKPFGGTCSNLSGFLKILEMYPFLQYAGTYIFRTSGLLLRRRKVFMLGNLELRKPKESTV
jgi:hypothetical protein